MSKSEQVEACDRFMTNIVLFILPFEQRRFVLVDYSVCSDAFARSQQELQVSLFQIFGLSTVTYYTAFLEDTKNYLVL